MTAELFRAAFPRICDIVRSYLTPRVSPESVKYALELMTHGTSGGKQIRGVFCAMAFLELTHLPPTSPEAETAFTLGWALEVLQAGYLVADDLMDQSPTRRGQPCWYLRPDVGRSASRDGLFLENCTFIILESLRGKLPDRVVDALIDCMSRNNIATTSGQSYDFFCDTYSLDLYQIIVTHKTSYYTVWLPHMLGVLASETVATPDLASGAFTQFLLRLGYYFQVQDDYLDVYGNPDQTGKVGTDIMEGKVTWLACTAFKLANEQQADVIRANLKVNQEKVVEVYEQLKLREVYHEFARREDEELQRDLGLLDPIYPKETLGTLLKSIARRNC
jgi:farnesyl diphosphate synthase